MPSLHLCDAIVRMFTDVHHSTPADAASRRDVLISKLPVSPGDFEESRGDLRHGGRELSLHHLRDQ
eukprot:9115304-Alexandrium_andersonii.AAC.1